jgi:hypothetical protein
MVCALRTKSSTSSRPRNTYTITTTQKLIILLRRPVIAWAVRTIQLTLKFSVQIPATAMPWLSSQAVACS